MNLEDIMLSELSQTQKGQKDKYCMNSLICGILKKKFPLAVFFPVYEPYSHFFV